MILSVIAIAAYVVAAPAIGTLKGTITDSTGAKVAGATVTVTELGRSVQTGADGSFAFADLTAGKYTIVTRRAGFAPVVQRVTVDGETTSNVSLVATALRLDAISVTATRTAESPRTSPLPQNFLSGDKLRREEGVSLSHSIDGLAGVRMLSTGQQTGKPIIHGLTGPRVLTLDNGSRLEDYSWSDEDGPSIDARLAERVEVVRGPASLMFGSDALGGVVNVVPPEVPDARGMTSFAHGLAETYGATNNKEFGGVLRLDGASGGFGWRATAIGRKANIIRTPTGNAETADGNLYDTGFKSFNGELVVGNHHDRGDVSLRYARYGGDFGILDGPPVPEDNFSGPLRRVSDDRFQLNSNTILNPSLRLETKSQYQRHLLQELLEDSRTGDGTPVFDLLLGTYSTDLLLHHSSEGEYSWLSGTVGVSGQYQKNTTSGLAPLVPSASSTGGAVFAIETATLGQWSVMAGMRGDTRHLSAEKNSELMTSSQTRTGSALSGNFGAVYRFTNELSLAGNVGRAFRFPTLFEMFTNGPHLGEDRYETGLPSARPETSLSSDVSLRWQTPRLKGELTGYRNRIADYLYISPTGQDVTFTDPESGESETLPGYRYLQTPALFVGADVSAEVEAAPMLTVRGRFDLVHATNRATDEPLPLIPPARGDVEAELHTVGPDRAYVNAAAQIVANQQRLGPFDTNPEGYHIFNFGAGIERAFAGRSVNLDVRVHNALDAKYTDFLSRYKTFAYEQGRNIVVRLSTGF